MSLTKVTSNLVAGTTTNDNAPTGGIGEFISGNPGGTVNVTTSGSYITITSISLTAGDWDVSGWNEFTPGATFAGTLLRAAISLTNNALDSTNVGGYVGSAVTVGTGANSNLSTGLRRISISTTTTVYLVGRADYTVLNGSVWGTNSFISARRVR